MLEARRSKHITFPSLCFGQNAKRNSFINHRNVNWHRIVPWRIVFDESLTRGSLGVLLLAMCQARTTAPEQAQGRGLLRNGAAPWDAATPRCFVKSVIPNNPAAPKCLRTSAIPGIL
jgi:hypothetical protein